MSTSDGAGLTPRPPSAGQNPLQSPGRDRRHDPLQHQAQNPPPLPRIDKRRSRQAFERAAPGYDETAVLQREVGRRLAERLDYVRLDPQAMLDLGSGTGAMGAHLRRRYPAAWLLSLDFAPAMLRHARGRLSALRRWRRRDAFLCADAESLPLKPRCLDLVISNLMLQWCNDLPATFAGLRRTLRPGGLFMFTTFGPDTLRELRRSWQAVDDETHVHAFLDMHDIGDLLLGAGFADPVMDVEYFTLTYAEVRDLMADLKALGARNAAEARSRGLLSRRRLRRMIAAYETQRRDGRLPATYEVIHGHCWAPASVPHRREGTPGISRTTVPLTEIGGRGRNRP